MAPLRSAYRPSMDAETRERPAALSLARGAPTASCLLLAGRSPGPAARSDDDWFGVRRGSLDKARPIWTSVVESGAPSAVEVEIARRALLEPEPIVLGRLLQELGCLLQHVLGLALLRGAAFGLGDVGRREGLRRLSARRLLPDGLVVGRLGWRGVDLRLDEDGVRFGLGLGLAR